MRKLYEPHLFPKAKFFKIFDKYFGGNNSRQLTSGHNVCTVGFEPNVHLTKVLKDLQTAYKSCGWKVKFYTETAASHSYGQATFYSDGEYHKHEWGASIVQSKVATKPIGVAK